MLNPDKILQKAKTSPFYRAVLNWSLARTIPFNKSHGFKIVELSDFRIKIMIPYRRSNFNHIRGLHACSLATISEFATGFLLISNLNIKKYRLIMPRLEMDYHYQGKMDSFAEFSISKNWLDENIINPLKVHDAVVVPCEVKIHDAQGNQLTTGRIFWQVKDWSKVKTKT